MGLKPHRPKAQAPLEIKLLDFLYGEWGAYYLPIRFKDREQCVMLSQLRLWDGKRLTHKMGQLPDDQFAAVKQALRKLLK
jgi:hypothetical protein